jgi:hypothetical protein
MVSTNEREGLIKGINMRNSISLSHLLFVYKVILFEAGTFKEAQKYKEILDIYCKAIGMEINILKSSILFNEVKEEIQRQCMSIGFSLSGLC